MPFWRPLLIQWGAHPIYLIRVASSRIAACIRVLRKERRQPSAFFLPGNLGPPCFRRAGAARRCFPSGPPTRCAARCSRAPLPPRAGAAQGAHGQRHGTCLRALRTARGAGCILVLNLFALLPHCRAGRGKRRSSEFELVCSRAALGFAECVMLPPHLQGSRGQCQLQCDVRRASLRRFPAGRARPPRLHCRGAISLCQIIVLEAGLEPAISSLGGRRLIHQATRAGEHTNSVNSCLVWAFDNNIAFQIASTLQAVFPYYY